MRRLQARFAAGQVEPACAAAKAQAAAEAPWPEARIVCAALARDMAAVELGLDLLDERRAGPDPSLAGLARAAVAGARFALQAPVPDDPLLLPLLRARAAGSSTEAALASPAVPASALSPTIPGCRRPPARPPRPPRVPARPCARS